MEPRTTPLELTPQILIQFHIELEDHKFWGKIAGNPAKTGK